MDPQKRIDKILEATQSRIQDEVAALLGVEFTLTNFEKAVVSKTEAFDNFVGKQICAKIDVVGEVEGCGGLFLGVKDAIRLGGTLIMLPSSELDEMISREEYSEEIEDSYGEIANIIAGSFTQDFEEMYHKSCRFVRKEQEKISPAKVEIESEEPVKNEQFYQVRSSMNLAGASMGEIIMLIPATPFGLQLGEPSVESSDDSHTTSETAVVDSAVVPDPVAAPVFNIEKHKKRVDRVLTACQEKMAGELGALLGVDVDLTDLKLSFISKEDFFFETVLGKQVIADMDVVGDLEDKSFFSIGLKNAIYLGGLMIMLPPSELENAVNEEDFGEDAKDAYGEIANIISGVYTSVFEEQYTKTFRFIKKSIQQVAPMKVEPESDEPIPNRIFYLSSMSLSVDGKEQGEVHMLFPADMLQLNTLVQDETGSSSQAEYSENAKNSGDDETDFAQTSAGVTVEDTVQKGTDPSFNIERHKKRVDKILGICQEKMGDEVGALLGIDVRLIDIENRIVNKEDFFFEEVSGKQIIANMDVVGEIENNSFLSVTVKDAIRIGGTLIMLPESELHASIDDEDFNPDMEDAFGEIANIISGVVTAVFEEEYTKRVRFIKTGLQQIIPMKVDLPSGEPIPDQDYYVSSMGLVMGDKEFGRLHLLFPAEMLQLDRLYKNTEEGLEEKDGQSASIVHEQQNNGQISTAAVAAAVKGGALTDILLISDDETEVVKLRNVLVNRGFEVRVLSFKDDVYNFISRDLKAVYLVTREVDEQAFGVAIKVSSSCSLPLIAAAPGWTRTKVIKAVKYGIKDILLTPADTEDIEENIANNLLKLAA